jgi:HD-like signal output (HDOD) protein
MKSVLFVDDEQPLLDGLRWLLRKQRAEWRMEFVTSAQAALALLRQQQFDIVVSDMRMPGIDGASLLQTVRDLYPSAARVILSGQSTNEELLRGVPAMQQFLTKPCEPARLKEAVQRLCRVQDLLANDSVRKAIGAMEQLPSFPGSYHELVEAAACSNTDESAIAEIIERDPALSVRVLQLANSVHYRVGRPVASVRAAVRYVGLSTLRALALSTQVFGAIDPSMLLAEPLRSLQDRSLLKAQLAREWVGEPHHSEEAFTVALLLDVGQIVLACCCRSAFQMAVEEALQTRRPQAELERQHCGVTHAEVGAYFLALWGMPASMVDIVGSHQFPPSPHGPGDALALAVHAADVLVDVLYAGSDDPLAALKPLLEFDPECATRLSEWSERASNAVAALRRGEHERSI